MSIYCPFAESLGITTNISILDIDDDYNVFDSTISSMEAIKRNQEIVECPRCGVKGNRPNMMRWHFENCKTELKQCKHCANIIPRQDCKDYVYKKKMFCDNVCYNEFKKGKIPINMTSDVKKKISEAALKDSKNRSERMKLNRVWEKSGRGHGTHKNIK